jgi:hypothetical protein
VQGIFPQVRKADGSITANSEERFERLREGLFPAVAASEMEAPTVEAHSQWPKLKEAEIEESLTYIASDKAPGPDGVKTKAIKVAWEVDSFKVVFYRLLGACVSLGYHPLYWRVSTTVVLQKPNKKDYREVKAYRPISLLNTMGKVLEKVVQNRLTYLTYDILPKHQFGARPGYSAPDAVLKLKQDVQKCKKKVTTAMMIDVEGAFDNVHRDTLINTLKRFKIPSAALSWTYVFRTRRSTALVVDGRREESKSQ